MSKSFGLNKKQLFTTEFLHLVRMFGIPKMKFDLQDSHQLGIQMFWTTYLQVWYDEDTQKI